MIRTDMYNVTSTSMQLATHRADHVMIIHETQAYSLIRLTECASFVWGALEVSAYKQFVLIQALAFRLALGT